jgi:flagellin-specific chaperone FliS
MRLSAIYMFVNQLLVRANVKKAAEPANSCVA